MKISDSDLQEFVSIHQEEFGETLPLAEASEMAFRLVSLYAQLTNALSSFNENVSQQPLRWLSVWSTRRRRFWFARRKGYYD